MSKLLTFISFLFISINIQAQTTQSSENNSQEPSETVEKKASENKDYSPPKYGTDIPAEKSKPVTVPLISADNNIVIDGKLDEELWKTAVEFKDFIQVGPGDNIAPSKETKAYMMYDEKHLYIAFKCWDEKDKIRATVAKRDSVFGEDNVRVWLDTYNDQRRAYILGWNPLGIQADGIFTEGRGADYSIDIVMESKGIIHDWGWSVEVKIPFKSLRYVAGEGKMWGFNAARNIDRLNDEFDSWMPDDRNVSGFLIKHGKITGLNEIKSERTLEIVPSITFSETGSRVSDINITEGRFVNQPIKQDIGLTLKYTITPNITLDAAINPDFAEVEADAPIVQANRRFPVFFNEKRPFFLEGAEIFQTPFRVFHSRTIVDPDVATKLTGKIGKNSFGFLLASDNAPGNFSENEINDPNRLPFISEFVDKNALFAILRLKRDIGKENSLGFLGSARVFPERKNYVAGFDGRFKLNPKTVSWFQLLGTHTRRCHFESDFDDIANPSQAQRNGEICGGAIVNGQQELGNIYLNYRTGNGVGYNAGIDYSSDTFGYVIETVGKTKDYLTDAGFTSQTDIHSLFGGFRKSTKSKPKNKIIRINNFNSLNYNYASDGRLVNVNWGSNVNISLQNSTFVNIGGGAEHGKIYEDEFGLSRNANRDGSFFGDDSRTQTAYRASLFLFTRPSKKLAFRVNMNHTWNSFDFDFGAGPRFPRVSAAYQSYLAEVRRIEALPENNDADQTNNVPLPSPPGLDPGTGKRLNFGLGVELSPTDPLRLSFSYDKTRLVRNDTGLTAFNTNIFSLRSTYQFTRFIFARARIDYDTLQSNIRGQYLFGWNPSPGKAFYIGYNDNSNYNGFNPYTGQLEQGFARNSQTFFIRMSYLFRKSF